METEDPLLTIRDVREAGYCVVPGARDWFVQNGLDFRNFVKNGMLESEIRAVVGDNGLLDNVVKAWRARNG